MNAQMSKKEIEKYLASLESKGYVKVGVHYKNKHLDVLMIHKDWTLYDFFKNFKQAFKDIPEEVKRDRMITVECPTLEMYEKNRTRGPKHKIIVDGTKPKNPWTRKGWFYVATVNIYSGLNREGYGQYIGTVTKKLGFITYHFIRWIHGDEVLRKMANKINIPRLFRGEL